MGNSQTEGPAEEMAPTLTEAAGGSPPNSGITARRTYPGDQPPVVPAKGRLVLRPHDALDRIDLAVLTLQVSDADPHLLTPQLGEGGAVIAKLGIRRSERAWLHGASHDRLEALCQVFLDLALLLVAIALRQHARGPFLCRPPHPLVLHDALVELVQLPHQGR